MTKNTMSPQHSDLKSDSCPTAFDKALLNGYELKHHTRIEDIKEQWTSLYQSIDNKLIFHNYDVISTWYDCFLCDKKICIFSIWHDNSCVGMFPMTTSTRYGATIINSLYEPGSSHCTPLADDEHKENIFVIFIGLLFKSSFKWHTLRFSEIFTYSSAYRQIESYLTTHTGPWDKFSEPTYCIDLDISFDKYIESYISSGNLKSLKRKYNKMKKGRYEFLFLHDKEAYDNLQTLIELEDSGWKKDMQVSMSKNCQQLNYTQCVAKKASETGHMFLALLNIDGVVGASHYGYIKNKVYYIVKTAYCDTLGQLSPSILLFIETVKYCISNDIGVEKLNLFPKAFGYKHKYTHDRDLCNTYTIPNNNIPSRLLYLLYKFMNRSRRNEDILRCVCAKDALKQCPKKKAPKEG